MDQNILTFNIDSEIYLKGRPKYPNELYESIVQNCMYTEIAWDCGCGNGQVSIDLVNHFKYIEATDINEKQIENSFQDKNIRYTLQESENTNFIDEQFDLVCAAQCIHWFDLQKYFKEVKRVLKPQGIFACWGYSFFSINNEIDKIVEDNLLHPINQYWSERNRILHNHYNEIEFPFAKVDLPNIQMNMIWNVDELLCYLSTWSAVKLYNEQHNSSIIRNLKEQLKNIWNDTDKQEEKWTSLYIWEKIKNIA